MPTIFIEGYKFRFYSTDRNEPPHVHVIHAENVAKIWLGTFEVAYNHGYDLSELNRIIRLARENHRLLLEKWNEYFSR